MLHAHILHVVEPQGKVLVLVLQWFSRESRVTTIQESDNGGMCNLSEHNSVDVCMWCCVCVCACECAHMLCVCVCVCGR